MDYFLAFLNLPETTTCLTVVLTAMFLIWGGLAWWIGHVRGFPFKAIWSRFALIVWLLAFLNLLFAVQAELWSWNVVRVAVALVVTETAYKASRFLRLLMRYPSPHEVGSACTNVREMVEEILVHRVGARELSVEDKIAADLTLQTLREIELRLRAGCEI